MTSLFGAAGLGRSFQDHEVLRNINLQIFSGAVTAVVGLSGVGKTTLLDLISGELAPSAGEVERGATRVAYATQNAQLLPWRSALENVALAFELRGDDQRASSEKAKEVLASLGLLEMCHLLPSKLSGGMKQKVVVAQTIATGAGLMLFDEPFSSMDVVSWGAFGRALRRTAESGVGVVVVTHLLESAIRFADRILVLKGSPATVVRDYAVREQSLFEAGVRLTSDDRESERVLEEVLQ